MPDTPHLLIAHAAPPGPACRAALRTLRLPRLEQLLTRLTVTDTDADPADAEGDLPPLAMPHERVLARARGLALPAQQAPWAALSRLDNGEPPGDEAWAWLTPCHWQVGMDSVLMQDPQTLRLAPAEAEALRAAMAPYFAEDGLVLLPDPALPGRWLARGAVLRGQATASLDRVVGQNIKPWLHAVALHRTLQRLHSEMQMLLYTHPVNDERAARGLATVNAFWVHGAGALAADAAPAPAPTLVTRLRESALRDDATAWTAAWQETDARECANLLAALDAGGAVCLTLASDRAARTLQVRPRSLAARMSSLFGTKPASSGLEAL
jgi:hypothetical protein